MAREGFELFGCRGCGSAAIEVALAWIGASFVYHDSETSHGQEALRLLNPLVQVPTLRFQDGTVMTESAAIIIALDELIPAAGLLPPAGTAARRTALRWLCFVATNVYAAIGVGDYPERWVDGESARAELDRGSRARLQTYWQILENAFAPEPFLTGTTMTMLDVYVATVSWWRPGRKWLAAHCPRLTEAFQHIDGDARVAPVWARNFARTAG
jgi:GST-like protein